ncbi:MAG: aminopeptidase [Chloroflexota bacterium]
MIDGRIQKLAKLLVSYCVSVKPGDKVVINGELVTRPLMLACYKEVINAGGLPFANYRDSAMQEYFLNEGNNDQLEFVPELAKLVAETYDCAIGLMGTENTRILSKVDPARQRTNQIAQMQLQKTMLARAAAGEFRWVGTMFPTQAYAQEADMSLSDYETFVYNACLLHKENPVAEWKAIQQKQQKYVDFLKGKKKLTVKGPHVDLTMLIDGRTFINDGGENNMPGGEIFTGPVEESVNGWIRYSHPAIYAGREVDGVKLHFEEGKVVKSTAKKNEEFLNSVLDSDPGARYLGEFAIGTNNGIDRFSKSILFDEKIGGTIHMAVGAGYPESGSKNESAVHWDMICDMRDGGQIWVDDELFYESGNFLI